MLQEVDAAVSERGMASVGLLPDVFGPAFFGFLVGALIVLIGGDREEVAHNFIT